MPGSTDIVVKVEHPLQFLDNLQLFRIADGVAAGNSLSFAWPTDLQNTDSCSITLSVGLEHVDDQIAGISNAVNVSLT